MLHSRGLLAPCFVPSEQIRQLRSFCRLREDHLELAAAHIQHMQRALDLLNIRVHQVLSQLHGVSGLRIVEAILAGERNPEVLAALCDRRVQQQKHAALVASLEGEWQDHHLFALRQAHAGYAFCQKQMVECDREIEAVLQSMNAGREVPARDPQVKVKSTRHNPPQIAGLYEQLRAACEGRDLQVLPAIGPLSWMKLLGELGPDLSAWGSEKQFTNWLGLSAGSNQSGHRRRRVPRRKTRAGQIFREAVMSLARSKDCALGEFYRRLRATRGAPVAIVATARKLAELYWRVMVKGIAYVEEGLKAYAERQRLQRERALHRSAAKLGYKLEPLPSPNAA
jgi:hypothetical protein